MTRRRARALCWLRCVRCLALLAAAPTAGRAPPVSVSPLDGSWTPTSCINSVHCSTPPCPTPAQANHQHHLKLQQLLTRPALLQLQLHCCCSSSSNPTGQPTPPPIPSLQGKQCNATRGHACMTLLDFVLPRRYDVYSPAGEQEQGPLLNGGRREGGHSRTHALPSSCMTPSINTTKHPATIVMTTEFLRVKKLHHHHHQEAAESLSLRKRMELQPELSLAPAWPGFAATAPAPPAPPARSSSSESDGTSRKKRKHYTAGAVWEQPPASLELQLNDPLPLDWEQCLDLQCPAADVACPEIAGRKLAWLGNDCTHMTNAGNMYYLNRKTLKKSWVRPREQSVNLDLNISTAAIVDSSARGVVAAPGEDAEPTKRHVASAVSSGGNNMVAVPCANCHLLVMLCKSSPSCPNCKFVQPLAPATPHHQAAPPPPPPAHRRLHATVKPLETLSLLH
ncbi:hypothetical protein HU200_011557 [Digitaria exilis]|uniref:WW domain-containing protein n=1 Tax=Digitaria exilis TaxID=1010633 RepID=A0A835FFN2_9POAL|nr:hypothetical protein HU200_011557 [Digitaria exilis]